MRPWWMASDENRELVKVLDVGIVKVGSAEQEALKTRTGELLGTPS